MIKKEKIAYSIYARTKPRIPPYLKAPAHMEGHLNGINTCLAFFVKVFKIAGLFNEKLYLDYVDNDLFEKWPIITSSQRL